jgi:hypothetical protein
MDDNNADNLQAPPAEADPRFPSGPWSGFWIQDGMGRQTMRLTLSFSGGKVSGHGTDIIGRFTFEGTYDLKTGRCLMVKQYEAAHRVQYDGVNEGDGMWLWGVWRMEIGRGGFHLWPEGEEDPTRRRLKAEKELPATPARPRREKEGELVEAGATS